MTGEQQSAAAVDVIGFSCACGKRYRVKATQAGRRFTCPACGAAGQVPAAGGAAAAAAARPSPAVVYADVSRPHPQAQPRVQPQVEPTYPPPAPAIPKTIAPVPPPRVAPPPCDRTLICGVPVPTTIGQLLALLLAIWVVDCFFLLVLAQVSTFWSVVARLAFLATTVEIVRQAWRVIRANQRVLHAKDVSMLWGLVRLVAWDPVEGVLFLRNKSLGFCDDELDDGHGGIRFMYPVLGEELALRVPLELQTLRFSDEKVMTREYLSVTVRGSMKWRIVDLKKFYLLVSRELRTTGEHTGRDAHGDAVNQSYQSGPRGGAGGRSVDPDRTTSDLLAAAIEWLRLFAEEQTRLVVSRVSSGLLIADRLSSEVPEVKGALQGQVGVAAGAGAGAVATPAAGAATDWTGAADGLARTIYQTISARVGDFGIRVEDVTLQEIRLPDEIVRECVRACKTAYLPLIHQREATKRRADLGAEVDLLGREAVATREIVGAAPNFTLADFLTNFLSKKMSDPAGLGLGASAAQAALTAATATAALPPAQPPAQPPPAGG
ncbi:MAG TPA: SPFH domain-containing protein [Tepidisphaeraceae bacterium]|nr:SPFH domain-containing protein [Tepidisphaeraceae bacterium]